MYVYVTMMIAFALSNGATGAEKCIRIQYFIIWKYTILLIHLVFRPIPIGFIDADAWFIIIVFIYFSFCDESKIESTVCCYLNDFG